MDQSKGLKNRHNEIIEAFVSGDAKIVGDHPKEVLVAIDSFMHAGKMMIDTPELKYIPSEYVENLISELAKHPQYSALVLDLVQILKRHDKM